MCVSDLFSARAIGSYEQVMEIQGIVDFIVVYNPMLAIIINKAARIVTKTKRSDKHPC